MIGWAQQQGCALARPESADQRGALITSAAPPTQYPLSSSSGTLRRRNHASLATAVLSKGEVLLIVSRCRMPISSATIGRSEWFVQPEGQGVLSSWVVGPSNQFVFRHGLPVFIS